MPLHEVPPLETDPRNREELRYWLERREQQFPGEPLSPREYLMVERLRNGRRPYADM